MNDSFPARYFGKCAECDEPVQVDDMVVTTGDGTAHVDCPEPSDPLAHRNPVCSSCFVETPCDCEAA